MTEQERSVGEILNELFKKEGKRDAALRNLARVRSLRYEIGLWWDDGLPLGEVDSTSKYHFSKFYLKKSIPEASEEDLKRAIYTLDCAINSCHERCVKLLFELNEAYVRAGVEPMEKDEMTHFISWLTFAYKKRRNNLGEVVTEKPYSIPILDFTNQKNYKDFWDKMQYYLKKGLVPSIRQVLKVIQTEREMVRGE